MFFDTLKFTLIVVILAIVFGALFYSFTFLFNKFTFFIGGQLTAPIEELAMQKLKELSTKNYSFTPILQNVTEQQAEVYKKFRNAREKDEMAWLVWPFLGILGAFLIYTGWTEIRA